MAETRTKVLHLVGGVDHRGGLMNFVVGLAATPVAQVEHLVWKHRQFQPPPAGSVQYVCRGLTRHPFRSLPDDLFGAMREVFPLWRWARQNPGAILHAHTRLGHFAGALVSRATGLPLILHFHALPRRTWVYRAVWRGSGAELIFNSRKTFRWFGWSVDKPLIVMPPIAWPTGPAPSSSLAPRYVMAGAFVPCKNLLEAMEAYQRVAREYPDLQLFIHGLSPAPTDPVYQSQIIAAAQACKGVTLVPYDPDWTRHLTETDVFVHAADIESFGIVILEAFSRGCRVVVPSGSFLDDFTDSAHLAGVHQVHPVNAGTLAEQMAKALECRTFGREAWEQRRDLQTLFSFQNAAESLAPLYRSLANRNPAC